MLAAAELVSAPPQPEHTTNPASSEPKRRTFERTFTRANVGDRDQEVDANGDR
jgi:hypothetical protein